MYHQNTPSHLPPSTANKPHHKEVTSFYIQTQVVVRYWVGRTPNYEVPQPKLPPHALQQCGYNIKLSFSSPCGEQNILDKAKK